MKQLRGCSRFVFAPYTYAEGKVTFGTVKVCGEVKNISREINSESEEVWADNKLNDTTFGGTSVTRTFGCTRIDPDVEAELLGKTVKSVTIGEKEVKLFGTAPDGSTRPYFAFGYALHDGDANKPCEIVWAFKGIVNSISQASDTIDRGTGSQGQDVNITFNAPDAIWSTTGKTELDNSMKVDATVDNALIEKWFAQVVTYDNAAEVLA